MEELYSLRIGIVNTGMTIEIIIEIIVPVLSDLPEVEGEKDGPGIKLSKEK